MPRLSVQAQEYRNLINTRFNTVASGPMQAIVVDVANPGDSAAVQKAVLSRVSAVRRTRDAQIRQEIDLLRRTLRLKGTVSPGIPDIVYVRQQGRLVVPNIKTRSHDPNNNLTFNFPTSGDGSWTPALAQELSNIRDVMYPALRNVYGAPFWNGTVTVINGDNLTPIMSDPNAISGGIYNVSQNQIIFAQYNSAQSRVFNLTQMMAIAFRGPASISYDAWERGMARAATLESVRNALPALNTLYGNGVVTVADPLWHALDRYDLLNQPALGNDRFFPVSKTNGQANTASFPNMLVPRLMMSGSVWLKAMAESPSFLRDFNALYYAAFDADANLKNSTPGLKNIAAQAVPGGNVEGMSFQNWYERQFVLDTSISPGVKLYTFLSPLRPNPAETPPNDDDFAFASVLYYYQTTFDTQGNSDEVNLSGTSYPIYWDFNFSTRLFLAAQYERVDILQGQGAVAPTFFNTIGAPDDNGRMRVAIDFPINLLNNRQYVAPRSMGKTDAPNNFWGVVVGADTGKVRIQTDTGVDQELPVKNGAFGGILTGNAFTRPSRATLTFTNDVGVQTAQRQVNLGYNEYVAVFYVNDPVTSVTHTFPAGPAMISFPIQPLKPRAAEALLNPGNDTPLFNDGDLLLAQWRQNILGEDKYMRYPTLDPIQPGKGYWSNFGGATPTKIVGRTTSQDQDVSIGLLFGWNQIASPYDVTVDVNALQFQYLADNVPVDLSTAIGRGWIAATNVPTVGQVVVWDYNTAQGYVKATQLEPWKGYFIRVLVSEGVTITYPNPTTILGRRASIKRSAVVAPPSGWAVPLQVRGPNGIGASAWFGQTSEATTGFDAKLDTLRPPDFSRAVPTVAFSHPDWGANAGDYFTDIRRSGLKQTWEFTVNTPEPDKSYTLSWSNLNGVPRSTRLVLVDKSSGQRQYLQTSSGYSFTPGNSPTRKFEIVAEERGRSALRIMNVVSRPTRAGGGGAVEIAYDLSQGATVSLEIRGIDGKPIRKLTASRAASEGSNTVIWDGRNDTAISVSSGQYLVHITARTQDGETARIVQPVLVVR